jgi:hypothetical protein
LVPHSQQRDCCTVLDFVKRDIARPAILDHHLPQERLLRCGLAASKRKRLQKVESLLNCHPRSFGSAQIRFRQVVEQAL